MGVIRVEHNDNYTVMSNEHLRDRRLSLRAMGLMSRMLSDADNYQHSIAGLAAVCREGRDAVRKALQELEAAGYLVREQTRKGGSFSACDYTLYEHSRTPYPPLTENPSTVNPSTENPPQRNTKEEEVSKEESPQAPRRGAGRRSKREPKEAPDWKPERFARFWAVYPRGEAKQAAIKAWDALKADDELLIVMGRALQRQLRSEAWQHNVGVPYASTWLNQRRWTDEEPRTDPDRTQSERRRDIGWI